MESPQYIKALLKPNGSKPQGRRVWSIDLESVWLPFFTATNTQGDTALAAESLGAPLRLAYDKDGTPKFSQTGRPVVRVVKEVADSVRLIRENFVASLVAYSHGVAKESPDGYKAQVLAAQAAGQPIVDHDKAALIAIMAQADEAQATCQAQAEAQAQAEPIGEQGKGKARAREAVAA
jgi:hypothetical protein